LHLAAEIALYLEALAFVGLAVIGLRLWRRHGGVPAGWVASAFAAAAAAQVLNVVVRRLPEGSAASWTLKVDVALMVIAPYLLFRFMAALRPQRRWLEWTGASITVLVAGEAFLVPGVGARTTVFSGWRVLFISSWAVQWTVLLVAVAVGFLAGGQREPGVAQRRMRLLGISAIELNLALVVSLGTSGVRSDTTTFWIETLTILGAALFALAFSPPRFIREAWRRPEYDAMQAALGDLISATTASEVTARLLPAVAGISGGRAVALMDQRGKLIGAHGLTLELASEMSSASVGEGDQLTVPAGAPVPMRLAVRSGALLVWTSPFAPLFGDEELRLLRMLAGLADLALERCQLFAREREFIADATHQLRTPLTVIAGVAATLAKHWSRLTEEQIEESLAALERQGERVRVLVQNLLDISQVEMGRLELNFAAFPVAECMGRVAESFPAPAGKSLEVRLGDGAVVIADAARLEQILANLLVNAYRYGGQKICLEAIRESDCVILAVRDDGPGVPENLIPHLFQTFIRGDNARGIPGSGLGLAVAKRLTDVLGGRISYEADQPTGARFVVRLRAAG